MYKRTEKSCTPLNTTASRTYRPGCCLLLDKVPLDILLLVVENLDIVSTICLRSTSRRFHYSIPLDYSRINRCTRWWTNCILELDRKDTTDWIICVLCKKRRHKRYFGEGKDWALIDSHEKATKWSLRILDQFPWLHRYGIRYLQVRSKKGTTGYRATVRMCCDHVLDRFETDPLVDQLLPFIQMSNKPSWMWFPVLRCMHCGNCASRAEIGPCHRCLCNVCPTALSTHYYRQGSRGPYDLKVRRVCRTTEENRKGRICVAEVGSKCPCLADGLT